MKPFELDNMVLGQYVGDSDGKGDVVAFYFPIEGESKVECINPVLVTEQDAIDRFNKSIEKLNCLNKELESRVK